MNTETHLPNRSISAQTPIRAAAFAVLCALVSAAALADQAAGPTPVTRVAKISIVGLDLSTPLGAHVAYERIKTVAQRLCFQLADPRKIDFQTVYVACVAETLADAVRRINAPTLTALEK